MTLEMVTRICKVTAMVFVMPQTQDLELEFNTYQSWYSPNYLAYLQLFSFSFLGNGTRLLK